MAITRDHGHLYVAVYVEMPPISLSDLGEKRKNIVCRTRELIEKIKKNPYIPCIPFKGPYSGDFVYRLPYARWRCTVIGVLRAAVLSEKQKDLTRT